MTEFKKRILTEYIDLTHTILTTTKIINESNYYGLSQNIEREVQRMIGRLRYRD